MKQEILTMSKVDLRIEFHCFAVKKSPVSNIYNDLYQSFEVLNYEVPVVPVKGDMFNLTFPVDWQMVKHLEKENHDIVIGFEVVDRLISRPYGKHCGIAIQLECIRLSPFPTYLSSTLQHVLKLEGYEVNPL